MNNEICDLKSDDQNNFIEVEAVIGDLLSELVNIVSLNRDSPYSLFNLDYEGSIHNHGDEELASAKEIDEYFSSITDVNYDSEDEFHMEKLKCDACESKKSLFWRRVTRNQIVCNVCFFSKIYLIAFDDDHLNGEHKSTSLDDLMDILGEELGLNECASGKRPRAKSGIKAARRNQNAQASKQSKQKFQSLSDQQPNAGTRPLTRTTAKASLFQTQVSSTSSATETQNGEEESCGSSATSESNLNLNSNELPANVTTAASSTTSNTSNLTLNGGGIRKSARVSKNKLSESTNVTIDNTGGEHLNKASAQVWMLVQ